MAEAGGTEETPWAKGEAAFTSKFFDPCQEAAERSIKCLHRNGGDRQLCMDYFQSLADDDDPTAGPTETAKSSGSPSVMKP